MDHENCHKVLNTIEVQCVVVLQKIGELNNIWHNRWPSTSEK